MLRIAKEANMIDESVQSRDIKLHELREKMMNHPAFSENNTLLEKLADKYNVKIIWCPKYHCEINPIEGVWCDTKWYFRKNNDQEFKNALNLVIQSFDQYENKELNIKLWKRFWKCLDMYNQNASYQNVLQELFGAKSTVTVSHKNSKHFNTNLN